MIDHVPMFLDCENAEPLLSIRETMNKLYAVATLSGFAYSSRLFARVQWVGMACLILLAVFVLGSSLKSVSQRWLGDSSRWRAIAGGASYLLAGVIVSITFELFTHPNARPIELMRACVLTFSWSAVAGIAAGALVCLIVFRVRSS